MRDERKKSKRDKQERERKKNDRRTIGKLEKEK